MVTKCILNHFKLAVFIKKVSSDPAMIVYVQGSPVVGGQQYVALVNAMQPSLD